MDIGLLGTIRFSKEKVVFCSSFRKKISFSKEKVRFSKKDQP